MMGGVKSGLEALRFLVGLPRETAPTPPRPRPTAAQLRRHAERFGPEQVAETADELGLEVDVSDVPTPRRPRRRRR